MKPLPVAQVPITHARDACFLCGAVLNRENRSKEHVFPEWLLHAFDLWYEEFTLPTGQRRAYRKLVVPCCTRCNNESLSRIEGQIRRSVTGGYDSFRSVSRRVLYQWLSKIVYSVLYLDAGHLVDLRNVHHGTIREPIDLERFRTFFSLLQSVRLPVRFARHAPPWSIFVFRTEKYGEPRRSFDYADNPELLTVALRMNDIGVVACLEDDGRVRDALAPFFKKLRRHAVTDAQFQEVVARTFYGSRLRTYAPGYLWVGSGPTTVFAIRRSPSPDEPPFHPWIFEDYAAWLAHYTHQPYGECMSSDRQLMTTLPRFRNFFT